MGTQKRIRLSDSPDSRGPAEDCGKLGPVPPAQSPVAGPERLHPCNGDPRAGGHALPLTTREGPYRFASHMRQQCVRLGGPDLRERAGSDAASVRVSEERQGAVSAPPATSPVRVNLASGAEPVMVTVRSFHGSVTPRRRGACDVDSSCTPGLVCGSSAPLDLPRGGLWSPAASPSPWRARAHGSTMPGSRLACPAAEAGSRPPFRPPTRIS